ncbi:MAG TPA: T9SS type A sorting domain-containing protein [Chitinophagaceae bacterium]|nr:T9SS type A sorting domain-containing protein [Chitinophagaceae bacterium]
MKQLLHRGIVLFLFVALTKERSIAQATYDFKSGTLIAGTALSVGAVYQFNTVKTGVDATVTITAITGGISITDIDGGSGFNHALQPVITVPAKKNGYIEMRLDFYAAGTKNAMVQAEVPITPIDVDGQMYSGLPLYEYDEIDMPNGYTYFQWAGSELNMSFNGTFARGKNKTAVDYPGIDTVQKTVMFTTINANISSITFRVGADNQSNSSASRLRSLYFQKFSYPYEVVLPNRTLLSFSGTRKDNGIELKGTLSASHTYDKLVIEKGNTSSELTTLTELDINGSSSAEYTFTYFDNNPYSTVNFYRIRLINTSQGIKEVSNTLMVKMNVTASMGFKIYNTMVSQNKASIAMQSDEDADASLQIVDMSGRVLYKRQQRIYAGANNIDLSDLNAGRGYYVVVVQSVKNSVSQKIIIY